MSLLIACREARHSSQRAEDRENPSLRRTRAYRRSMGRGSRKHSAALAHPIPGRRGIRTRAWARPRTRLTAAIRLVHLDGTHSYFRPRSERECARRLARCSQRVEVVLIEELDHVGADAPKRLCRLRDELVCHTARTSWHEPVAYAEDAWAVLTELRRIGSELRREPLGWRLLVETTEDGHVEVGAVERAVAYCPYAKHQTAVIRENRRQVRSFDPAEPESTRRSAEHLGDMCRLIEWHNCERRRKLDEAPNARLRQEVLQERRHEKAANSRVLRDALLSTIRAGV